MHLGYRTKKLHHLGLGFAGLKQKFTKHHMELPELYSEGHKRSLKRNEQYVIMCNKSLNGNGK